MKKLNKLNDYAKEYGIDLDDRMISDFSRYMEALIAYNEKVNLTAITKPEEIVIKHFLDSLLPLTVADFVKDCKLIDVGTGAGFPGVPIKIVRPDIRLTLLDSLQKRIVFLIELSEMLGQDNELVHVRAEACGTGSPLRENYDIAVARAVAPLPALAEYCLPYVKKGGYFIALKGYDIDEELKAAEKAVGMMGGQIGGVKKLQLPMDNRRSLVIIEKISQTPSKYPRRAVKITKTPL